MIASAHGDNRQARAIGRAIINVWPTSSGCETQKLERNDEKAHRHYPSHTGRRHAVARWPRGGSEERVHPRRLGHALLGRRPEPGHWRDYRRWVRHAFWTPDP